MRFSQEAEAAKHTTHQQRPQGTEPRPQRDRGCGDRDGNGRPTCVRCARHDRAAGDHRPHNDRNQTEAHDLLPWRVAEPVPYPVGGKGGPKVANALATAPGNPQTFQPTKLIIRIMFGPGIDCAMAKTLAS